MTGSLPPNGLSRAITRFEQAIVSTLVAMMMAVIAFATLDLGWIIVTDLVTPPIVLLGIDELLDIFGFFLLILIGIELLGTMKAYLETHAVHVEIVLELALIAIARKIIVLDVGHDTGLSVIGIAALVLALAVADHVTRRARQS